MKIIKGIPPKLPINTYVAIDSEWLNMNEKTLHRPTSGKFALLTFCYEPGTVYYIDDPSAIQNALSGIDETVWLIHNAKFDITQMRRYADIPIRTKLIDTYMMERILWNGYYDHFDEQSLARRYLHEHLDKSLQKAWGTATEVTPDLLEYACRDSETLLRIWYEQKKCITKTDMQVYKTIDLPALWAVLDFQGFRVDRDRWIELSEHHRQLSDDLDLQLPINPRSPKQVIAYLREHGFKGLPSSGEDILEEYGRKYPNTDAAKWANLILLDRGYRKLASTYGKNMLENYGEVYDGCTYFHGDFHVIGASTGRMSCVSADTILNTSRGAFRIDEYIPQDGDKILTHKIRYMPIIRKLFRGYEPVFMVRSSNGNVVQCTVDHRLLTTEGWTSVNNLHVGQEVISYVGVEAVHTKSRKHKKSLASLSTRREKTINRDDCEGIGNNLSKREVDCSNSDRSSSERCGEKYKNVPLQNWGEKPHVGQEWFSTSQLQRTDRRWTRILNAKSWKSLCIGASKGCSRVIRNRFNSYDLECTSYRWKSSQQRTGQLGSSNECRSSQTAFKTSIITEITFVGTMGVWDIEVARDHSYVAGGFISHNCSSPNIQNIPIRETNVFRECFISKPESDLVIGDYSQQEVFIMAYFSQDSRLLDVCNSGGDTYIQMAKAMFNREIIKTDPLRKQMKKIVLATDYGMSKFGLSRDLNCSLAEAEQLIKDFFHTFPGVRLWMDGQDRVKKFTTTVLGRKAYLNPYTNKSQRNAYNNPIQGTAADITKLCVTEMHKNWKFDYPFGVVALIHDEVVADVPKTISKDVAEFMKFHMEDAANKMLPGMKFKADVSIGSNWSRE